MKSDSTSTSSIPNSGLATPKTSSLNDLLPDLDRLWNQTKGDPSICIAVLDSAIDQQHACFASSNLSIINTADSSDQLLSEHGTSVASIIFSQDVELQGIAPLCRGIGISIYAEKDQQLQPTSQMKLAQCIELAIAEGAEIINISGGQFSNSSVADLLLSKVLKKCQDKGILVVAAAGNDGCECLHLPAAEPSVLAVGAMDHNQQPSDFSNWGKAYQRNGLLFPGNNIPVAIFENKFSHKSGTSYATPIASGIVALLLSLSRQQNLSHTAQDIFHLLLQSATKCDANQQDNCEKTLVGTINIAAALQVILGDQLSPSQINNLKSSTSNHFINSNQTKEIMLENNQGIEVAEVNLSANIPTSLDQQPTAPETVSTNQGITPSCGENKSCGCNSGKSKAIENVYTIGTLSYTFQSTSRQNAFDQAMGDRKSINNAKDVISFLKKNPEKSEDLLWIVKLDETPIYAVHPVGGYVRETYEQLREALDDLHDGKIHRISIPGIIAGSVTLMNGLSVPVLVPVGHQMYGWKTTDIASEELSAGALGNFLDRIYYELRNTGRTPEERAINFAATNAWQAEQVFSSTAKEGMELLSIDVARSPICEPNSDCWDVKLTFFTPSDTDKAKLVFRFTIDVSYAIPVSIGEVRSWSTY
ncbi:PatA/PatG family cyanobactin maturation protease [Aureispira sp. CCB-E]|uniref:PatA/PatG family cyanobactin maturation protease n=1 Tax=Aureispira sp. CCB-E TaxID=3051121 RepID=UPI0028694E5A|nr:PatA/PatG family cyanobactin maturation protease [Aureispira sp. CCB-E]WMX14698.1 PatA/PatG family cyanobactin maturation protease [Aureispira sp. CCB-E]